MRTAMILVASFGLLPMVGPVGCSAQSDAELGETQRPQVGEPDAKREQTQVSRTREPKHSRQQAKSSPTVHRVTLRCEAKGRECFTLYSFTKGVVTALDQADIIYGFDDNDCSQGALSGQGDWRGFVFPVGHKSWKELSTIKVPPKQAQSVRLILPLGKGKEGLAFWVKTRSAGYIVARIRSVQPASYSDLVSGGTATLELEWSRAAVADLLGPQELIELLGGKFWIDEKTPERPLVHVNLGYTTAVNDGDLKHLKGLSSLQTLILDYTQVTSTGLEHLKGMTSLQMLWLSDTQVTDAGLEHLKGLTSLHTLKLCGTRVTGAGLEHLKGLADLRMLDLNGTRVTDAGLEHLEGLACLQELYLGSTRVTDAGLVHLKGLPDLQLLWLSGTQVTDAGLMQLKGLASLQKLYISETRVSDAGLAHLKGLTELRTLDVCNTEVTDAGAAELEKALPRLQRHGISRGSFDLTVPQE